MIPDFFPELSSPGGDPFSHPSGSSAYGSVAWLAYLFEPKTRPCGFGLPPARFFAGTLRIPQNVPTRQDTTLSGAQSRDSGIQKTFSAGPRSFNSGELWFPTGKPARVQPFCDSRHGRIVCKSVPKPFKELKGEPPPSNQTKEFLAQPHYLAWQRLSNSCGVHALAINGEPPPPISSSGSWPTPLLAEGGSLNSFVLPGTSWPDRNRFC